MTSTLEQYEDARAPLTEVIEAVPTARWAEPSPCAGWTARDVVRHLVETQRDFLAAHADLGDAPDVDADPATAWRQHSARVVEALRSSGLAETAYDGAFGPTTVGATLAQFYVWDMIVHRWDIARATGAGARLTEAELRRVESGADSFGDALYSEGVCRPGVEAPPGAGRDARVLARLGRVA